MYENFSKLLQKHGVTAYKVSKETGVSQSTLSDWKRGISTPKPDKLQKIADYFGVPLTYFLVEDNGDFGQEIVPAVETDAPYYIDEDTAKTAQEIFDNDKILFDVYRTADKDRLVDFAKKLAELRKLEEGDD